MSSGQDYGVIGRVDRFIALKTLPIMQLCRTYPLYGYLLSSLTLDLPGKQLFKEPVKPTDGAVESWLVRTSDDVWECGICAAMPACLTGFLKRAHLRAEEASFHDLRSRVEQRVAKVPRRTRR